MLWVLLALAAAIAAAAFVLAPLVRAEEDIDRIHRSRPGVRNIRGPTPEELQADQQPSTDATGKTGCPHCGAPVTEGYRYCGQCSKRLQ
ncbi:DUF7577 domain-containing protein [Halovenus halobia]|uniref:DUF7577 domain-containing protein n=1 Tax=Halovenus halobia TaxID=3396622 RepID=UPI003F5550E1